MPMCCLFVADSKLETIKLWSNSLILDPVGLTGNHVEKLAN